jgi:hypothetical protein
MKGVRQGTFIMLAGVLLTISTGLLTVAEEDFVPLLFLPAICYIVGFLRILYAVFVQDRQAQRKKELQFSAPAPIARQPTYNELPPPRSVPVDAFVPPNRRTAEVIQPPSVTENTTKLLDDES